ncbi:efflux RND transporter periplasmic adaptor subunit [Lonepinella koalarum]|uniref:HlyD family secretion protein n=1 Tax=Lonepinella koalarum TaxID=53417 RepID=UPI0011E4835E|nr:efflux RND transporter periplasmic adaptor subunit [Lonepinella koalarum]TYG34096.1 efflux RND transporter periplasmic adaptor subunit [Lonepinella koalarum]
MKKFLVLIIIAAIAGGVYYYTQQGKSASLDGIASVNGRLELERFDVATLYAGRVEEVFVKEGDDVVKDQELARLSSTTSQSKVDAAQAQIAYQEQQVVLAQIDLDNALKLRRGNLVAQTEVDNKQAKLNAALAAVEQAKAQEREVASQNVDMMIKSPLNGRVEYKIAEPGNVLGVGGKVVSILDLSDVYMNVFLPSYQSNLVRIGDEARIKVDGTDYVFPATITYVAADAQFTPKSVETEEERAKLVFKVKLQVPVDVAAKYASLLKGGMTAMGYVKYDAQSNWTDSLSVKLPE